MRAFRIAYTLFAALVVFFFINSVAGKLFPAAKNNNPFTPSLDYNTDYYTECSKLQNQQPSYSASSAYYKGEIIKPQTTPPAAPDDTAYNKCLAEGKQKSDEKIKSGYDAVGKNQIRNVYVVLGVMVLTILVTSFTFRRWPLLSAALVLGGIMFTLYFPTSNTISSWYSSVYSMSDAVKNQLHNTIIFASSVGLIGLILISILRIEKKTTPPPATWQ